MAQHRVFFSYTGADRDVVEVMVDRLRGESQVECFAFEHDMRFGDNIVEEVRQRLHWCNFFVPVISSENHDRPWLTFEINTAIIRSFERECTLLPVLCDVSDGDLPADLRQYKAIAVQDSQDYAGELVTRLLQHAPAVDERRWDLFSPMPPDFDLPALLSWRVRLSKMHGRTQELNELMQWADDRQAGARVRIVSGPGGAGKTRLAAELAIELWKSGWDTRFIHSVDGIPATRGVASLWIIDYPEEQQDLPKFFREVRKLTRAHRVRILMLTRLPREWWLNNSSLRTAHAADLLGETFDLEFEELSADDTVRLYREVAETVARWFDKDIPEIGDDELLEWRSAAPEHRLPLYITALALRMVSSGATRLDLSGRKVMRELVWRERARVDAYGSQLADSPEEWPSRVLGLAALTDCLQSATLRKLADEDLEVGMPPQSKVVDLVRKTPLWDRQQRGILPLRPDIFAAAFLHEVLSPRDDVAPEWLWATIEPELSGDNTASVRDRIGRVIFDVQKICDAGERNLSHWLQELVQQDPARAMKLMEIASDDRPPEFLLPLLVEINSAVLAGDGLSPDATVATQRILGFQLARQGKDEEARRVFEAAVALCESTNNERELALCLQGLSSVLDDSDSGARVAAATRALDIQRKLAAGGDTERQDALARALNAFGLALDDQAQAIAALGECADIYCRILEQAARPDRHVHEDSLARAYFNLANAQWNTEQHDAALESSRRSVEIRRRLYSEYRWRYARYFAMSLNQFAIFAQATGDARQAESASSEAVEIYTHLYKANPAQFGVDLARAMGRRASAAEIAGDRDRAMSLRQQQAKFVARVLSEGRIARYSGLLGDITLQLVADGYNAASRNPDLAIDVCTQAIDILNTFRASDKQLWEMNMHYVLVGGYLNRGNAHRKGQRLEAIEDYGTGMAEADRLREEHGFYAPAEVAKELCLLNRCIERIRIGESEAATADVQAAFECDRGLQRELGDDWPLREHGQVLMSLSVLRDDAGKLHADERARLFEFGVRVASGLLANGNLSPKETAKTLLSYANDLVATDRELAAETFRDAVNAAAKISDENFSDLQEAGLYYNNAAYQMGSVIAGLGDYGYMDDAVDMARRAVAVATNREHMLWGQSRETLGYVAGLKSCQAPGEDLREESKAAFREAIGFFRDLGDDGDVAVSIADWEKVHGSYNEDED